MYNKEELLAKEMSELESIAQSMGALYDAEDDKESIIYSILDKQAIEAGAPRRPHQSASAPA